jgi:hypothetical protein
MFERWRRIFQQAMLKIELIVIAMLYGLSWIMAGFAVYNVYGS